MTSLERSINSCERLSRSSNEARSTDQSRGGGWRSFHGEKGSKICAVRLQAGRLTLLRHGCRSAPVDPRRIAAAFGVVRVNVRNGRIRKETIDDNLQFPTLYQIGVNHQVVYIERT